VIKEKVTFKTTHNTADKRQGYKKKLEQETVILENGGVMPEVKCK